MAGGKAAMEAGAVTHGAVRCSAWLGVSFIAEKALAKEVADGANDNENAWHKKLEVIEWLGGIGAPEARDADANAGPKQAAPLASGASLGYLLLANPTVTGGAWNGQETPSQLEAINEKSDSQDSGSQIAGVPSDVSEAAEKCSNSECDE